jgi:hypothetical protein
MQRICCLAYCGFILFLLMGTTLLFAQDTAVPKTTVVPFSIEPFRLAVVLEAKVDKGTAKIQLMNTILRATTLTETLPNGMRAQKTTRLAPETIVSQLPLLVFSA